MFVVTLDDEVWKKTKKDKMDGGGGGDGGGDQEKKKKADGSTWFPSFTSAEHPSPLELSRTVALARRALQVNLFLFSSDVLFRLLVVADVAGLLI